MKVTIECECGASVNYGSNGPMTPASALACGVRWYTKHGIEDPHPVGVFLVDVPALVATLAPGSEGETAAKLARYVKALDEARAANAKLQEQNFTLRQALDDLGPLVPKVPA